MAEPLEYDIFNPGTITPQMTPAPATFQQPLNPVMDFTMIGPTPGPQISGDARRQRAIRYHQLLGPESPGIAEIEHRISQERGEDTFRADYTARFQQRLAHQRNALLLDYLQRRPEGGHRDEEVDYIRSLTGPALVEAVGNPETFFERLQARRMSDTVDRANDLASGPIKRQPDYVDDARVRSEQVVANRQFAQNRFEEMSKEYTDAWREIPGALRNIGLHGLQMIPFLSWYNTGGLAGRPPLRDSAGRNLFPGNSLQAQAEYYYSLPPEQAARELTEALASIGLVGDTGRLDALLFVGYLASPNTSDQWWINLTGYLDIASVFPYRTTIRAGRSLFGRGATPPPVTPGRVPPGEPPGPGPGRPSAGPGDWRDATSRIAIEDLSASLEELAARRAATEAGRDDLARAAARVSATEATGIHPNAPHVVSEAAGDVLRAAVGGVTDDLINQANRVGAVNSFSAITNETRSIFDIQGILNGSQLNARNELSQRLMNNRDALLRLISPRGDRISRLPLGGLAEQEAANEAFDLLRRQYPLLSDHIVDTGLTARGYATINVNELPGALRALGARSARATEDAWVHATERMRDPRVYNDFRQLQINKRAIVRELGSLTGDPIQYNRRTGEFYFPRESVIPMGDPRYLRWEELMLGRAQIDNSLATFSRLDRRVFDKAFAHEALFREQAARIGFDLKKYGYFPFPFERGNLPNLRHRVPASFFQILEAPGNARFIEVRIGNRDALPFNSAVAAERFAKDNGIKDYRVVNQGTGWYVAIQRPFDETADAVRQNLSFDIASRPTPVSRVSTFLGYLRSGKYKVDSEIYDDMLLATYGGSYMTQTIGRMITEVLEGKTVLDNVTGPIKGAATKTIGRVPFPRMDRDSQKALKRYIDFERAFVNNAGERGMFSHNQLEFERQWSSLHNRLPNTAESVAYWTWVQLNDLNYVMLNLSLYRDKVRQGWQMFTFPVNRPQRLSITDESGTGSSTLTGIEGRVIPKMPERHADFSAGILVHDRDPTKAKYFRYGREGNPGTQRIDKDINDYLDRGYQIVHISHLDANAARAVFGYTAEEAAAISLTGNRGVNFVLTQEISATNLPYKQIPYRGGGNIEYPHRWFVKSADVREGMYIRDAVVHGVATQKEAREIANRYNEAYRLWKIWRESGGHIDDLLTGISARVALETYVTRNLPYNLSEINVIFLNRVPNDAKFMPVPAYSRTIEHNRPGVSFTRDIRDNPFHLENGIFDKFALERTEQLTQGAISGTIHSPIFDVKPADTIDAYSTLHRAGTHMMRNKYIGDLQIKQSEFFVQEFGDLIAASRKEIERDPMRTLFDSVKFPFNTNATNRDKLAAAENFRTAAQRFVGIRSQAEETFLTQESKVAEFLNRNSNSKLDLVKPWLLNTVRDPAQAAKNFMYRFQLMSPVQLAIQASGVSWTFSRAPLASLPAYPGTLYSIAWLKAAQTPEMLAAFQNRLRTFGWKGDQFLESHNAMIQTGFHNVSREFGWRANFEAPTMRRTTAGQVLDTGMQPFKWGEEFARVHAWHTSYQIWRRQNPRGILDGPAIREIRSRADDFNGNMTQAAVADWQRGVIGVPTGFWSYQARIFEQLADFSSRNRMTIPQKAMALSLYASVFGVPASLGILALGFPVVTWVNDWLVKHGIPKDFDQSPIFDFVINGFLGVSTELLTGTQYNMSERLSLGSSRIFTDIVRDKTALEMLMGAYAQFFRDLGTVGNPFLQQLLDVFRKEPIAHNIDWRDVAAVINQPGVSHLQRTFYAMNYGQYLDRTGLVIGDMTGFQSFMLGVFGVQPQDYSDMYSVLRNERVVRESQVQMMRLAQREFNALMDAADRGDTAARDRASQRFHMYIQLGGWRDDQMSLVFQRLVRGSEDRIWQVMRRHALTGESQQEFARRLLQRHQ